MTVRCAQCAQFIDQGNAEIVRMAKLGFWRCKIDVIGKFRSVRREVECPNFRPAAEEEVQRRRDLYRAHLDEHKQWQTTN
jgi:hypothetical protein